MTSSLLIDFGNVIGFFDHGRACRALARLSGRLTAEAVYAELFGSGLATQYERGEFDTPAFLAEIARRLRIGEGNGTGETLAEAFSDIFWPNPPVIELIPRLAEAGHRLILASNTNELHSIRFRRDFASTLAHFDVLVMSHEVGAVKPERRFFERCVGEAGRPPEECLYVDDVEAYLEGARALGIRTIRYAPEVNLAARLIEAGLKL